MKIRFVTVIWGEAFVDIFLRVGLRGLLAEGNALDVSKEHDVQYTIYTTAKDAEAIKASPLFARLCESVQVRFSLFILNEIDAQNSSSHGQLWSRGLELARRNSEILFLIIPDILYAKGTLRRWAALFEKGYGAVYTPGPFVALETALVELQQRFPDRNTAISVDTQDIYRFIGQHLHPLEAAMLRNAKRRVGHPEHDIRPVGNSGFVIRAYTSQPFCIDPRRFNSIRLFNVEDHLDLIAIEPCSVASLEPLHKGAGWLLRPARLNKDMVGQLGQWWDIFGVQGCLKESRHTYAICVDGGEAWRKALPAAVVSGGILQMRIFAARKIFRIIEKLNELGQRRSAQLVAMALFSGHALKLLRIPEDAILLVPEDHAFGNGEFIKPLMAEGAGRSLLDALMSHVVASAAALGARRSVRVVSGPHTVDGFSIYVVENVLFDKAPKTHSTQAAAPAVSGPARSLAEIFRHSASIAEDLVRRGLQRWRGPIRRLQLSLEPIPLVGPVTVKSMTVLQVFRREGFAGVRRRIDAHPHNPFGRIRNELAKRAADTSTVDGTLATEGAGPTARPPKFPGAAGKNALGEVRLLKGLLGMQDVLSEYESTCLPAAVKSVPLQYVGDRLKVFAAHGGPESAMARALKELVAEYPGWCEAWLELGFVNIERGQAAEAEEAFLKASQSQQFTDSGSHFQNPLSVACLERAGLLAARGAVLAACDAYRQGFTIDPRPHGVARAELAHLLQRAGHAWDAAEQYFQAAYCDLKFRPIPKAVRDAAAISFPALTATDREASVPPSTG